MGLTKGVKNAKKDKPFDSHTSQQRCYKEDVEKLNKWFNRVKKAYYEGNKKIIIEFEED